ncbi:MAG TPA: tetratricopeptide repeat protein [Polyangia bacterium]
MPSDRDTEEGLERLRAVVRANPRSTAFVALAHALCDSGLEEEAEEVARQGLGQHPHLVTGQVALGRALIARGRMREAQERLVEAAKSSPENGDAFRWLGELVLRRGQPSKARVLLEYAEELVPGDQRVVELLTEAGGVPQPRQSRPKTDFENTRVGNLQAMRELAERMHEDPPPAKLKPTPKNGLVGQNGQSGSSRTTDEAVTAEFEPQQARAKNGASPLTAGVGSAAVPPALPPAKGATVPPALPDKAKPDPLANLLPNVPPLAAPRPSAPPKGKPATATAARRETPGEDGAGVKGTLTSLVKDKTGRRVAAGALAVLLIGGVAAWRFRSASAPAAKPESAAGAADPTKPMVAAIDMTAAIAAGTHDGLSAVRALGKRVLEMQPPDPDQLAAAAFASALLANDYGGAGNSDALEMASAAEKGKPDRPVRTALIEGSRALVALTGGHLADARAAVERALQASPDSAESLLVQGRIALREGELAAAITALQKALARQPVITSAALDLATAHIDSGDVAAAEGVLAPVIAERNDLRALLLRAEVERAQGKPVSAKNLRERCRDEGRDSAGLRTWCAAETALAARVAGDRSAAQRSARSATAGGGRNPRALAFGSLVLANLGEIEQSGDALRKIRDDSTAAFVPRAWVHLALALGRGEAPAASVTVPKPSGPETRLVAARVAFARAGKLGLREFLAGVDPNLVAQDPDLAAFALLADESPPDAAGRAALEDRAAKGSGFATYVLGRLELASGDPKAAAIRLHRSLQASAEACEAARLLLTIDRKSRPAAVNTEAKVAALVKAHGGCANPAR